MGDKTGLLDPGTSAIRLAKPSEEMEKDDSRIGNEISYGASPDLKHHLPGCLALVILSTCERRRRRWGGGGVGGGLFLLLASCKKKKGTLGKVFQMFISNLLKVLDDCLFIVLGAIRICVSWVIFCFVL